MQEYPRQRPCPWFKGQEVASRQDLLPPKNNLPHGKVGVLLAQTPISEKDAAPPNSNYSALQKATDTPGSELRRAAVREIATELGMVNDAQFKPGAEGVGGGRKERHDSVDDFVQNTFQRARAKSAEPLSPTERDTDNDIEQQPTVQFSCRSSPAASADKSPSKLSVGSAGDVSPPISHWWQFECTGCDLKFCSKLLYEEHLLECPRAILSGKAENLKKEEPKAPSHCTGDDSLSVNTTDPTTPESLQPAMSTGAKKRKVDACHDGRQQIVEEEPPTLVTAEQNDDIALAMFLGGAAAAAHVAVGGCFSGKSLERLTYSSLSPPPSSEDSDKAGDDTTAQTCYSELDKTGAFARLSIVPEEDAAEVLRRRQQREHELARERELDTVGTFKPWNVQQGSPSAVEYASRSLFDLSEDESNVLRFAP